MKNNKLTKADCKAIRQAIIDYYGKGFGLTYEIQILEGNHIDEWSGDFVKVSEAHRYSLATLQGNIPQELSIFITHYQYGLQDTCYVFKTPNGWSCSTESGDGIFCIEA